MISIGNLLNLGLVSEFRTLIALAIMWKGFLTSCTQVQSIVQGRYDVVCPLMSAWDLHRAWPEADFIVSAQSSSHLLMPCLTA